MPSNLRQTNRECVYLVYFLSCGLMTLRWPYELDLDLTCKDIFLCRGFWKLSYKRHTYRETDRQTYRQMPPQVTTLLRGWFVRTWSRAIPQNWMSRVECRQRKVQVTELSHVCHCTITTLHHYKKSLLYHFANMLKNIRANCDLTWT